MLFQLKAPLFRYTRGGPYKWEGWKNLQMGIEKLVYWMKKHVKDGKFP